MKVKVNIRANYYYEKDKEDVEITLKIKGDYNLANLINQFAYIKHQKNQFFYFDSYYGIEFDISKTDIYELSASDLTIEVTCPPASITPSLTAPISPMAPPPFTQPHPRWAIRVPSS